MPVSLSPQNGGRSLTWASLRIVPLPRYSRNDPSSMKLSVHSAMLAGGGRPGPPGPLCIPKPESAEREDTRPVV